MIIIFNVFNISVLNYNISVDIVFIIEHYFAIPKCHGCFLLMVEMSGQIFTLHFLADLFNENPTQLLWEASSHTAINA